MPVGTSFLLTKPFVWALIVPVRTSLLRAVYGHAGSGIPPLRIMPVRTSFLLTRLFVGALGKAPALALGLVCLLTEGTAAWSQDTIRDQVMNTVPNLTSTEPAVRADAINRLRQIKETDQLECKKILTEMLLTNPQVLARLGAAKALGLFADKTADNVVDLLVELKATHDPERQCQLVHALSLFGSEASEAMPVALELIEASDKPDFQERLAFYLPRFGKPQPQMIPRLLQLLSCDVPEVRQEVISVLVRSGPSIIPLVTARLDDPNEHVRESVVETLGNIEGTQAAMPKLFEMMKTDKSKQVRYSAMEALGGLPEAAPLLVSALSDPNSSTRWYAANGLQRMGEAARSLPYFNAVWASAPTLTKALEDSDKEVRIWAVRAVACIAEAVQARRKKLLDHEVLSLRRALELALKTLDEAGESPTPAEEIARAHDRVVLKTALAVIH